MVSIQDYNNWHEEQARIDDEQDRPEEADKMQEIVSFLSDLGHNTKGLTKRELKDLFYRENEGEL